MNSDSPLFRQYQKVKAQYPDKLLFYRMGDFYELFYADAERAAALLGINLTQRKTMSTPIPMAGVPAHSVEQYIARLVRIGETVVVCDQVGEGDSGLMERKVTQIVTPGTLTDQELLPERSACIAMALVPGTKTFGYAWLDLARGELRAGQCAPERIGDQIARLNPAEMLLPEGMGVPEGVSTAVMHLPQWEFDLTSAYHRMCERFVVQDLVGFGLQEQPQGVAAAMALLGYAEQTQCRRLEHLWRVGTEYPDDHVVLDVIARRSLELTKPLADGGPTLLGCIDECRTNMGSRLLARRLHHPLRDRQELNARLDTYEDLAPVATAILTWLVGCSDVERIATRISLGSVRPRELAGLRDTLVRLPDLLTHLQDIPERTAERFALVLGQSVALTRLLGDSLVPEPSVLVRDGGVLAAGHNAELDRLKGLQRDVETTLANLEQQERERTGLASLRVGHNRVHGYYLELSRSHSNKVPERYTRRQTTKHAERFVTDELRQLEVSFASANAAALALEQQLYEELITDIGEHLQWLRTLADALADLDVAANFAELAATRNWSRPTFMDKPGIHIRAGRHPVVEKAVDHFVPNDLELGPGRSMLVVTGPNMGGKSTYMRQVALICLLAHIGAPVPADAAQLGIVDSIMTRIGAADDLAGGRSTFMVEMAETAAILNTAGPATLVILDEIGRGTSTFDGLSLAWAAAQTLLEQNKSLVLLATHYIELTELANRNEEAHNVHMAVGEHNGEVVMFHRIEPGSSSRSFGLQVARMAGIPGHALALAKKQLAQLEQDAKTGSTQSKLFAETATKGQSEANPALALLRSSNIDDLSPRQALSLLYELRELDQD